ncbi:flagellin [Glaciecola sp. KUL10]|uniref:flagellin N-terminal helical domain-containing protein n=1 Tax=Glaciecola sp. (strain KUL10) TaxID=2161813 RepID=UPI000D78949D|nr:flagellin [Glaciecola sp. KUL10]GBL04060.1 flagellin-like protein [Glaciecola sp. KUL10]
MSIFVNTNVAALNAQRNLFESSSSLNKSYERLASGIRINSAADDAAGLQISERITTQVQGLEQATRNANDAISLTQVAEGALTETTGALQRIRQLAVQAQNGINSDSDRAALQKEVSALKLEISRIATDTTFNGVEVLNGAFSAAFLVGSNSGQTVSVNLSAGNIPGNDGFSATGLGINALTVNTAAGASAAIDTIDAALSSVLAVRGDLGALENRFQSTIRNLANVGENLQGARSRVQDTDFATETSNLTRNQIIQQASLSILSQANSAPQSALALLG